MTQPNSSFGDDLNQILARQVAVLDEIDAIREREGALSPEIEKIQADALAIVHEIEALTQPSGSQEDSLNV